MLRGFYTTISSMLELQARQNVTANNIANIETTGYKSESVVSKPFKEVMLANKDNYVNGVPRKQSLGGFSSGVRIDETITNHTQGTLISSESNTSFGLVGEGMFTVQKQDGTIGYTRNGVFKIDRDGYLSTTEGYKVLGIRTGTGNVEPIRFTSADIHLDSNNNIIDNGVNSYKFNIVNVTDKKAIVKDRDNLYKVLNGNENLVQPLPNHNIKQFAFETSNVDVVAETTNLMTLARAFEANQSIIKTVDSTLYQVANEIGKI